MRPKILIDTDPGTDDAQALIMLLLAHQKSEVEIIGISTVRGNTDVHHANNNALRILEATNLLLKIPVFTGATDHLVQNFEREVPPYHGKDGFGDVEWTTPVPRQGESKYRFSPLEIVDIVNKYPGEVILLAIGPLTNIAIAMSIDSQLTSKLKDIYMMGGNITGVGNISPAAEFNFFADPEAAKIVLDRTEIPIKLVPWETCFNHGAFSYTERSEFGNTGTCIANFLNNIDEKLISNAFWPRWITCDQIASSWLLDDLKSESDQKLVGQTEQFVATVETNGTHTRGMMVRIYFSTRRKNIIAMKSLDNDSLKKYITDVFNAVF